MKKDLLFFIMICPILLLDCANQKEKSIEGFWDLQYQEWSSPDTTILFKRTELARQIKVFGKEYFTFVMQNPDNENSYLGLTHGGGGTYKVTGDTIIETYQMFPWSGIGHSFAFTFEILGDTLIQKGPINKDVPEEWEKESGIEIYTRLE